VSGGKDILIFDVNNLSNFTLLKAKHIFQIYHLDIIGIDKSRKIVVFITIDEEMKEAIISKYKA